MSYKLYYFLENDTIAVRELKENREGRDHFPMLLKRTKLPKNWKQRPVTYPSCYMEISDVEVNEYYQPKDLIVGETIFIFGRRFLLLNCDPFTRSYYENVLKQTQSSKLAIKFPDKPLPKRVRERCLIQLYINQTFSHAGFANIFGHRYTRRFYGFVLQFGTESTKKRHCLLFEKCQQIFTVWMHFGQCPPGG